MSQTEALKVLIQDKYFTKLYNAVLQDPNLYYGNLKILYAVMGSLARARGVCWSSYPGLAEKCGFSESTAFKGVQKLIGLGYVKVLLHGGCEFDEVGKPINKISNHYSVKRVAFKNVEPTFSENTPAEQVIDLLAQRKRQANYKMLLDGLVRMGHTREDAEKFLAEGQTKKVIKKARLKNNGSLYLSDFRK